jgi:hypothetical protein
MNSSPGWKFLVRKPRSAYKQLFVKDHWIAARTLYGQSLGEDARTAEALANDYDLPLQAVQEAIAYCESNPPEIREDWEREESIIGRDHRNSAHSDRATQDSDSVQGTAHAKKS